MKTKQKAKFAPVQRVSAMIDHKQDLTTARAQMLTKNDQQRLTKNDQQRLTKNDQHEERAFERAVVKTAGEVC